MSKKFEVCPRCQYSHEVQKKIDAVVKHMEAGRKAYERRYRKRAKTHGVGDCPECQAKKLACGMHCVF